MSGTGSNLIVAIDSQALIWGVRQVGTAQELQRAKWLFEYLDSEVAQIIVPSIVLSEYLCPIETAQHLAVIAAITDRFLVMPFDVQCASMAADLFNSGNSGRPKGTSNSRKVLRADSLIVATAARHGAKKFYCADKDCRSLAKRIKGWEVLDLPNQPNNLFDYGKGAEAATEPPNAS